MNNTSAAVQEAREIHHNLQDDLAYQYSVENNDEINMQMVLRAYGYSYSYDDASLQIKEALAITC